MNVVLLQGVLSSEPRVQTLPSGAVLVNWEVTTEVDGAKQSVPIAWFDPPRGVHAIGIGDEVLVSGSVRRRFYQVPARTVSRTEVLGRRAVRASHTKQAARLREVVLDAIEI